VLLVPRAGSGFANPAGPNAQRLSGEAVVLPVTLFYQGVYYDASLYKATPVPMALEPDTFYEVQRSGGPLGEIAVQNARRAGDAWRGEGWVDFTAAKGASASDDRPVIRRRPGSDGSGASSATSSGSDDSGRPILRRRSADAPPRKPSSPSTTISSEIGAVPVNEILIGVSDPRRTDSHSFALTWPTDDLAGLKKHAEQMAADAVAAYIRQSLGSASAANPPRPNMRRSPTPARTPASQVALQNIQARFFDLDSDNNPEIVLTAEATAPQNAGGTTEIYVALVLRQQGGTDWYTLFSNITDDRRLDEFPRLELLDAVDADGNGNGELLFRTFSTPGNVASASAFLLYQPYGDRLRLLYDSRGAR
jgi:hypothetical protein